MLVANNGQCLAHLPPGARVGTSSLRRAAQVLAARPDLTILSLRGNVDTRIRKILQGDYDAIILAAAGVERLGLEKHITEHLAFEVMLPAPGQGALAVQCRANDAELRDLLAPLHDRDAARAVSAERAFLAGLGGGCSAPIAAYAQINGATISITGLVASLDGRHTVRVIGEGQDPLDLGSKAGTARPGAGRRSAAGMTSLTGKRILVTRPRSQAADFVEQLAALGAVPVIFPTIALAPPEDFAPLDQAIQDLSSYSWVIFTSANGAAAFFQRLDALGKSLAVFSRTKIAAIGPATASALAGERHSSRFYAGRIRGGSHRRRDRGRIRSADPAAARRYRPQSPGRRAHPAWGFSSGHCRLPHPAVPTRAG